MSRFLIFLDGIPLQAQAEVDGQIEAFRNEFPNFDIARTYSNPNREPPGRWSPQRESKTLQKLEREILKHLGDTRAMHLSKSVIFVGIVFGPEHFAGLKRSLHPIVPVVPLDAHSWNPSSKWTPARKGEFARWVRMEFAELVSRSVSVLECLELEFRERLNRTGLLLPIRNFHSEVTARMHNELGELFCGKNPCDGTLVHRVAEVIENEHWKAGDGDRFNSAFLDARDVRFAPARIARHAIGGIASEGEHVERCFLGSVVRWGAPYHRGFHYDCTAQKRRLPASWTGCHDQPETFKNPKYLNIGPNDYCRG